MAALSIAALSAPSAHAGVPVAMNGHVSGRDDGGSPVAAIAGASVELQDGAGTPLGPTTTTDASGNYTFTPPCCGPFRVVASKTGYVTQCRVGNQDAVHTTIPAIELPETDQAGTLNGTVTDSVTDSPIQDVTVDVGYEAGCASVVSTVTGSNGAYVFASNSLPGPVHKVVFSAAGYHSLTQSLDLFTTSLPHNIQLQGLDVLNPKTKIKSVNVDGRTATVKFKANDPEPSDGGINFTCALDGDETGECASPKKYRHLHKGKHHVTVVAYDAAGNFDETPAKAGFRIG